jgi:HEAT repeat protein
MSDDLKESKEELEPQEPRAEETGETSDEFVDEFADTLMKDPQVPSPEAIVVEEGGEEESSAEEEEFEEEKVKDEIDIQIDLLKDSDWVVRREAVVTLGEMADERCIEPLVRCLRDGDWQVREAAVDALAMIGSPAVELLIRYLRDWEARKYTIRTLGKINDERVLDPLISMMKNDEFKDDATWALAELGKPAVGKLVESLNDRDEFVRKQSILALGEIKDPEAVDALVEKLKDPDWFTRLTAAASLEKIGDPRGRDAVKPLLKDPDLVVRMRIERMLSSWKKQEVNA